MPDKSGVDISRDEELIARVVEGERELFGVLVERYWNVAVALALTKINDPDRAESIAQESFIKAYGQLRKLRKHSAFGGWLAKIVLQTSVNYIRTSARERLVLMSEIPERAISASAPDPSNPGLSDEERTFVRRAVGRLPEKFQKVIIMRFMTDLSTAEIARRLGRRAGTVRVWLHRAYKMLRRDLTPFFEEVKEI